MCINLKTVLNMNSKIIGFNVVMFLAYLFAPTAQAQHTAATLKASPGETRQDNRPYPRTQLAQADSTLAAALKQENGPIIIHSLLERTSALLEISQDSFPALIKQIETICDKSQNTAEKSILQSILAEFYQKYYDLDQWNYNSRKTIVGEVPTNISEWSGIQFIDKIYQLSTQSIAPATELQKIDALDYVPAITAGEASRTFRPTLFDFLAYRTIDRLRRINLFTANQYYPQAKTGQQPVMAPIAEFDRISFEARPVQIAQTVFSVYQQLLRFHLEKKNVPALISANISRLSFAGSIVGYKADNRSDWQKNVDNLWNFYNQYKDSPYATEILIDFNNLIPTSWETEKDVDMYRFLKQLLSVQEAAVNRFPDYNRIGCLKNAIERIRSPYFYTSQWGVLFPGEKKQIDISYRNIRKLNIKCFRLETTALEIKKQERSPEEENTPVVQTSMFDIVVPIADTLSLTQNKTKIELPALSPGFYLLQFYADSAKTPLLQKKTNVTGLYTIYKTANDPEGRTIVVTDAKSGKPLSEAKVKIYKSPKYQTFDFIETLVTDKQGIAFCTNKEASGYVVSYKDDAYLPFVSLPGGIFQMRTPPTLRLSLFTDRAIYRPGQLVQFSGVLYDSQPESRHVLPNESVDITLRDVKGNLVYEKNLVSDSLGSFSGEITIPAGSLTGNYTLRAEYDNETTNYQNITVSEYKRPTFKIDFGKPLPDYSFKTPVTVSGRVVAYSGYALPDAIVKYTIVREPHYLRIWPVQAEQIASGEVKSNEKGDFTLSFLPQKSSNDQSRFDVTYQYRIVTEVTSPSGETQSGSTVVSVADLPIIIKLPNGDLIDKNEKGLKLPVSVMTLNGDTLHQPCKYILYSLYDNQHLDNLKPLDSLKIHKQLLEQEFQSGDSLAITRWQALPSGPYRMVVQTKDKNGNTVSEEASFTLYSTRDKRPPLLTESWTPQYALSVSPGETLDFIFGSSFDNVFAYVELYDANKRISLEIIKFSNKVIHYPVTYKPSYQGDLSVCVTFVKNSTVYQHNTDVRLNNNNQKLTVQTIVFRDKLRPGATEEWTFSVKDAQGRPVSARFLATMYDASLQGIRPHNWYFYPAYSPQNYAPQWNWPSSYSYWFGFDMFNEKPADETRCVDFQYDQLNIAFPLKASDDFWVRGIGTFAQQKKSKVLGAITNVSLDEMSVSPSAMNAAPAGGSQADNYRTNFDETAFFYPRLMTDKEGKVSFRFTVPESNTEWQFMSLAYTRELLFGSLDKKAVSSKPLMVSANLPRFIRQGDDAVISVLVVNNGEPVQEGKLTFELFNPYTDSVLTTVSKAFALTARQTAPHSFAVHAPIDLDIVGIRVRAATGEFSDGEQQLLPVLPSRSLVTETLPFTLSEAGKQQFTLKRLATRKQSETLENYRLTLEYTANPIWFVVQALPALSSVEAQNNALELLSSFYGNTISGGIVAANPKIGDALRIWKAKSGNQETLLSDLEKNQSLKTILLSESPWVLNATNATERMQKLSELFDVERIRLMQNNNLSQLQTLQSNDGGWSWLAEMPSSRFITQSILEGMARLTQLNMIEYNETAKTMQIKALSFIDRNVAQNIPADSAAVLSNDNLSYLFVRSSFRDIPVDGGTMPYFRKLVDKTRSSWNNLSLPDKALAAVVLNRLGFKDEARNILRSLTEFATQTEEMGMFWQNNRTSQHRQEGAIRVHTLIMTAYNEIDPDSPLIAQMKRWLLMQKQTQDWGSTPATADAIYALLATGPDWLVADDGNTTIEWGGQPVKATSSDLLTGYLQQTKQGDQINAVAATVQVSTTGNRPSWGALYWQYFENFGRIEKTGNGLTVDKRLFVEEKTQTATKLVPVNETTLKPGQKLVVRLIVKCDRDLEFVHLKDQRAACFEQTEQLSGYRYQDGLGYYREDRDAFTNFFFDSLPKGEYVLTYDVWLDRKGTYNNGTTSVQCLYAPQYAAFTQGGIILIK